MGAEVVGERDAADATRVDAVVFDLGNVLIPFNPRWLFRKLLSDEASIDRFFAETDFDAWNTAMDAGRRFADGIAAHSRRFPHYLPLFEPSSRAGTRPSASRSPSRSRCCGGCSRAASALTR